MACQRVSSLNKLYKIAKEKSKFQEKLRAKIVQKEKNLQLQFSFKTFPRYGQIAFQAPSKNKNKIFLKLFFERENEFSFCIKFSHSHIFFYESKSFSFFFFIFTTLQKRTKTYISFNRFIHVEFIRKIFKV